VELKTSLDRALVQIEELQRIVASKDSIIRNLHMSAMEYDHQRINCLQTMEATGARLEATQRCLSQAGLRSSGACSSTGPFRACACAEELSRLRSNLAAARFRATELEASLAVSTRMAASREEMMQRLNSQVTELEAMTDVRCTTAVRTNLGGCTLVLAARTACELQLLHSVLRAWSTHCASLRGWRRSSLRLLQLGRMFMRQCLWVWSLHARSVRMLAICRRDLTLRVAAGVGLAARHCTNFSVFVLAVWRIQVTFMKVHASHVRRVAASRAAKAVCIDAILRTACAERIASLVANSWVGWLAYRFKVRRCTSYAESMTSKVARSGTVLIALVWGGWSAMKTPVHRPHMVAAVISAADRRSHLTFAALAWALWASQRCLARLSAALLETVEVRCTHANASLVSYAWGLWCRGASTRRLIAVMSATANSHPTALRAHWWAARAWSSWMSLAFMYDRAAAMTFCIVMAARRGRIAVLRQAWLLWHVDIIKVARFSAAAATMASSQRLIHHKLRELLLGWALATLHMRAAQFQEGSVWNAERRAAQPNATLFILSGPTCECHAFLRQCFLVWRGIVAPGRWGTFVNAESKSCSSALLRHCVLVWAFVAHGCCILRFTAASRKEKLLGGDCKHQILTLCCLLAWFISTREARSACTMENYERSAVAYKGRSAASCVCFLSEHSGHRLSLLRRGFLALAVWLSCCQAVMSRQEGEGCGKTSPGSRLYVSLCWCSDTAMRAYSRMSVQMCLIAWVRTLRDEQCALARAQLGHALDIRWRLAIILSERLSTRWRIVSTFVMVTSFLVWVILVHATLGTRATAAQSNAVCASPRLSSAEMSRELRSLAFRPPPVVHHHMREENRLSPAKGLRPHYCEDLGIQGRVCVAQSPSPLPAVIAKTCSAERRSTVAPIRLCRLCRWTLRVRLVWLAWGCAGRDDARCAAAPSARRRGALTRYFET